MLFSPIISAALIVWAAVAIIAVLIVAPDARGDVGTLIAKIVMWPLTLFVLWCVWVVKYIAGYVK